MKKLFIFGLGSLTGSKLAILARKNYEIFGTYNLRNPFIESTHSIKFDINKMNFQKILREIKPAIIVNFIAINNVDYCENNKNEAKKINSEFVNELAKTVSQIGSKLIHLSSDSIFDGKKNNPYTENDLPNPINFYGSTKLEAEKFVLDNSNNLIIRVSILYGWLMKTLRNKISSSMKPLNFGQWFIEKLQAGEKVKIIQDELSSPIIADDFAKTIIHLEKGNHSGIFHAAPQVKISRHDFCLKLARYLKLDENLISPTESKELGRKVTTGFNKCLDSTKLKKTVFNFMSLEESFELLKNQMLEK